MRPREREAGTFWSLFGRTILATGMAVMLLAVVIGFGLNSALAGEDAGVAAAEAQPTAAPLGSYEKVGLLLSIAITVGSACVGAGVAVGKVGAAAMGAVSERPEIMGRALIFVALAEGIAIYGLIIGIMLLAKL